MPPKRKSKLSSMQTAKATKATALESARSVDNTDEQTDGNDDTGVRKSQRKIKKTPKAQESRGEDPENEEQADTSNGAFTPFSKKKPNFQELRRICESLNEKPGRSIKECEERIAKKSGLTLEAAVNNYRRDLTASATAGVPGVQEAVQPQEKTDTLAKPNSEPSTDKQKDVGGFTEPQIAEYNRMRKILSTQRKEKLDQIRLLNSRRLIRLLTDSSAENPPEPVPSDYRNLAGWWDWAGAADRDNATRLLGGQADYGFSEIPEPSVQDVMNLRINLARYRPDLVNPTHEIDIIWRPYEFEQDRLKPGTIFTSPVENPGIGFVPRGPGRWVYTSPLIPGPGGDDLTQTAATVWQRRQLARAKNENDPTQHLDIAWEPQVPGLYSPRSSVEPNDGQEEVERDDSDDAEQEQSHAQSNQSDRHVDGEDKAVITQPGDVAKGKGKGKGRTGTKTRLQSRNSHVEEAQQPRDSGRAMKRKRASEVKSDETNKKSRTKK